MFGVERSNIEKVYECMTTETRAMLADGTMITELIPRGGGDYWMFGNDVNNNRVMRVVNGVMSVEVLVADATKLVADATK